MDAVRADRLEPRVCTGRWSEAWSVAFGEGDGLGHLYLADGHAGTVLNAHWAQAFAAAMKDAFDAPITPIADVERDAFLIELSNTSP